MHVRHALAQTLHQLRTRTLFGVVGEGNLYVIDSFCGLPETRYVAAAHEAGAVLMANGHAQISGEVAVATVTHGPGLTNTVTALVESVRNRSPLVLIAGEVAADDSGNAQAIEQGAIVSGTGAGLVRVSSAASASQDLVTAFRLAEREERPVVLCLPADLQWQEASEQQAIAPLATPTPQVHEDSLDEALLDEALLDEALGILASARRPLLLAGAGAATPWARASLLALAEERGARLATTLRAKDLFRGHEAAVGICGSYATAGGSELIAAADCVVAFGASLNEYTTMKGELLAGASVIQVDIEGDNLGRHLPVRVGLLGDSAQTAERMRLMLATAGVERSSFARQSPTVVASTAVPRSPGLDGAVAMSTIERAVPEDRTLAMDAGRFLHLAYRSLSNPPTNGYVHSIGFGVIGIGLANAIGAWFAAPERPVLHVTGDGGFMLGGLNELHTAVREGVDLIVVVINDGSYGAEHIQLRRRDHPVDVSMMEWPSFAAVAEALGVRAVTVQTEADLDAVAPLLETRDGPVLIDVRLDPDHLNDFAG